MTFMPARKRTKWKTNYWRWWFDFKCQPYALLFCSSSVWLPTPSHPSNL